MEWGGVGRARGTREVVVVLFYVETAFGDKLKNITAQNGERSLTMKIILMNQSSKKITQV